MTPAAVLAVAMIPLTPGVVAQHRVSPDAARVFTLEADAGQLVHAEVDQGETDVIVVVIGPDRQRVVERDARERGIEPVTFLALRTGTYLIEVRRPPSTGGDAAVRVRLAPHRTPGDGDERRLAVEQLSTDARQLVRKGDQQALGQAVELRRQALPSWRALDRHDMVVATLSGIGDALYRLNRYDEAREAYMETLELSRAWRFVRDEAETLNNLGLTEWRRGELAEGRRRLEEALPLWDRIPLPRGKALTSNNLGILLRQIGDYDASRQAYRQTLTIARTINDRRTAALALSNMGVVLDALGRPQEAIASFRQAAREFQALSDPLARGRTLLAQARTESPRDPVTALAHAREAAALILPSTDRIAAGDVLVLQGRLLERAGRRDEAMEAYRAGLLRFRDVGSPRGEADALHALAMSSTLGDDDTAALQMLREARDIRHALGLRGVEADTLIEIARLQSRRGRLADAQRSMEDGIAIIEDIQGSVFEREMRTSYLRAVQSYFGEYTRLLIARHHLEPAAGFQMQALQAVERARSRGLVERIRERQVIRAIDAPATLLARHRQLSERVNYWSLQVWQQADTASAGEAANRARRTLDAVLDERRVIEGDIRRADPRYGRLMQPEPLDVANFSRSLDADTVILEYSLGDTESFVWAITSDGVHVVTLGRRADIERQARELRTLLSTNPEDTPPRSVAARRAAARTRLATMLLEPVATLLAPKRRVLIIPDGDLHVLPFAALRGIGSAAALSARHDIVVSPSASLVAVLDEERRHRTPAPRLVAAIGDPVFHRSDSRVDAPTPNPAAADRGGERRLGRLRATRDEVGHILSMTRPGTSFRALDFDANRRSVLPRLADYRYIHFATHAVNDEARPELSGIVLSLVDRQGRAQNGFVRLDDVYALRLQADLVVLSACETAIGRADAGEGLVSLARAFFHGGSLRVLATLWPVPDDATAEMMRHFYQGLLVRGDSPAAALRGAQAAMRRDTRWSDEFYWSGFVLQGVF